MRNQKDILSQGNQKTVENKMRIAVRNQYIVRSKHKKNVKLQKTKSANAWMNIIARKQLIRLR